MYKFVGGYQVILPYAFIVFLFSLFNFYRESVVQEWADKASLVQNYSFLLCTFKVFAITFVTSTLIGVMLVVNMKMRISSSRVFFNMMLERVMHAPVNLYFDVTPIARILGNFNFNL